MNWTIIGLALFWIIVGWVSVFAYIIFSVAIKAANLWFIKKDQKGGSALLNASEENEGAWMEALSDWYEQHPIYVSYPWLKIFAWPGFLKVWLTGIAPIVQSMYSDRLLLLKQKGENNGD